MNWKRLYIGLTVLTLSAWAADAQLRLEGVVQAAREHYPASRQYELLRRAESYSLKNAGYGLLPQVSLVGKASYQSEVTDVSPLASALGIPVKGMSKDQYNLTLDVQQSLWDGGQTRYEQARISSKTAAELRSLDVELYALEARVEELYFGILLQDVLLRQSQSLRLELEEQHKRILSSLKHGTMTKADAAAIEVELLRLDSNQDQLKTKRKAYIEMLGLLMGQALDEGLSLEMPEVLPIGHLPEGEMLRPEYRLLEAKAEELAVGRKQIKASLLPKLSLFAQGGYGRPGLNMLSNDFAPYYIAGLRVAWNISAFYSHKAKLGNLDVAEASLQTERDKLRLQLAQTDALERAELMRLASEVKRDDEVIALRAQIKRAAIAKHTAGTATVSDLVREVQAEATARELQERHRLEWLHAQYKIRHNSNKNR